MTTGPRLARGVRRAPAATRPGSTTPSVTGRIVRVALVWRLAGGVLTVIATTGKRGASYHDRWSISPSLALVLVTLVHAATPRRPSYVSRAVVVDSSLAPDTTYTFSYAIVMRAGQEAWFGSGSVTLTLADDGSLAELAATTRRRGS